MLTLAGPCWYRLLPEFDECIQDAMAEIYAQHDARARMCVKPNVHTRLSNLPICPELTRSLLPRTSDIGRFLSISGTVIRATTVKMLEYEREFMCLKCKHAFMVQVSSCACFWSTLPAGAPKENRRGCYESADGVSEKGLVWFGAASWCGSAGCRLGLGLEKACEGVSVHLLLCCAAHTGGFDVLSAGPCPGFTVCVVHNLISLVLGAGCAG